MLTDIYGSTVLWESLQVQHKGIIEKAIDTHNNRLLALICEFNGKSYKSLGDGFLASFDDVQNAMEFALKLQIQMNEIDWKPFLLRHKYACKIIKDDTLLYKGFRLTVSI